MSASIHEIVEGLPPKLKNIKQSLDGLHQRLTVDSGPRKALTPGRQLIRHAALRFLANKRHPSIEHLAGIGVRHFGDSFLVRSQVNPAMTTVPTWAQELVGIMVADFLLGGIVPRLLPRLMQLAVSVELGRSGAIKVPFPVPGGAHGGWVGEGDAKPIVKITVSNVTISARKVSAISEFSNELRDYSSPTIESVIELALRNDLGAVIDGALTDASAATNVRPQGLRYNVAGLTTTGSMEGDLKALAAAVLAGGGAAPVYLGNPLQALAVSFLAAPLAFPFLASTAVPAGLVLCVDAGGFAAYIGEAAIEESGEATIHEEDTAPAAIVPAGGPASSPVRSSWQTDCTSLRFSASVGWGAATGRVAWMSGVAW